MNVSVAVEYRFARLPDGSVWTRNQYAWSFWRRYLDVFDGVRCLARVRDVRTLEGDWHRTDGRGVSVEAVPHYIGPWEYLRQMRHLKTVVRRAVVPGDAFLLRVPSNVGTLAWRRLRDMGYPYGVEVLGDPYDVFAPGAVRHPLRRFLRWYTTRQLREQCAAACAASYVTNHALQARYPAAVPGIAASCIELSDELFAAAPRRWSPAPPPRRLIFVGSLEQYYKGPDLLIRAIAEAASRGIDISLTIVGDGRLRPALEALSAEVGCRSRVHFVGQVPNDRVFSELDASDLFVLPSRTEGLPRAMIEAMARGLPCVGSDAGGIPELLPREAIVPRGDLPALVDRLCDLIATPERLHVMSARNLETARSFRAEALRQRRVQFYRRLREATERWLARGHGAVA